MYEYFSDWRKKTVDIKKLEITVDSEGRQTETESTVESDVDVNFWTGSSQETNVNDKFVNQATGQAILPPDITVTTKMWMEDSEGKYYITGVDDVAEFGELTLVSWRREYGE